MRKGTCKHHIGSWHNTHCAAGVEYRSVLTEPDRIEGSAYRYPCVQNWDFLSSPLEPSQQAHFEKRGTCPHYTEPSETDIKQHEATVKATVDRFVKALPWINSIKKKHHDNDWAGTDTCPICQGNIYVRHAAVNGHVWANCETEGCLQFIE